MLFGGVAWYLASTEPGRIMMLPVAIMGLAMFYFLPAGEG